MNLWSVLYVWLGSQLYSASSRNTNWLFPFPVGHPVFIFYLSFRQVNWGGSVSILDRGNWGNYSKSLRVWVSPLPGSAAPAKVSYCFYRGKLVKIAALSAGREHQAKNSTCLAVMYALFEELTGSLAMTIDMLGGDVCAVWSRASQSCHAWHISVIESLWRKLKAWKP